MPGLFVLLSFNSNNTPGHALSSFRDAEMNPMHSVLRALQCYPVKPLEMQIPSIWENQFKYPLQDKLHTQPSVAGLELNVCSVTTAHLQGQAGL